MRCNETVVNIGDDAVIGFPRFDSASEVSLIALATLLQYWLGSSPVSREAKSSAPGDDKWSSLWLRTIQIDGGVQICLDCRFLEALSVAGIYPNSPYCPVGISLPKMDLAKSRSHPTVVPYRWMSRRGFDITSRNSRLLGLGGGSPMSDHSFPARSLTAASLLRYLFSTLRVRSIYRPSQTVRLMSDPH